MRLIFCLLLLQGCALQQRGSNAERLERELEGRVAGEATSCIPIRSGESLIAADSDTLVLRGRETIWVNRLRGSCPGLRTSSTLVTDVHGSRYCRGDSFHTVEQGSSVRGPTCVLGEFVPYRFRR